MKHCYVPCCNNLKGFPFPKYTILRGEWINAFDKSHWKSSICSVHFNPIDFIENPRQLKENAVPSVFMTSDIKQLFKMNPEIKMEVLDSDGGQLKTGTNQDVDGNHKEESLKSENGKNNVESRQRRVRKSNPTYNLDTLDSDSDQNNEKDDDPEFRPSQTAPALHSQPIAKHTELTGYTLYCHENRESVQIQHPELSAVKLNMKLANLWSALPAGLKRSYSCRARHIENGGAAKKPRGVQKTSKESANPPEEVECDVAFCCAWGRCDYQFEVVDECAQHISDEHLKVLCHPDTETLKAPTNCCWHGCARLKRCSLPFVQFERLSRHMSEEHVLVGKTLKAKERSQHYIPRQSV